MKPLEGITVLDFSQFLSGPSATLRLADLGAEVIKIERPGGDIARTMYVSDCKIGNDSTLFHAINRNKSGISIDLKQKENLKKIEKLVQKADVAVFNFRPGVAEKLGLSYENLKEWNPRIIYGKISGYGEKGPWKSKPGQDLLAQSLSGVTWLNGNAENAPTPLGLSLADMFAGQHLVQGLLAALIKREKTGEGVCISVNLMESILDIQFEMFTAYLNNGHKTPQRSRVNNANAYIGAPYGIYETKEGYLALAMASIVVLGRLLECKALEKYENPVEWATKRDEIKAILKEHLKTQTADYWLEILEANDIWCAKVMNWEELFATEGFKTLDMIQTIRKDDEPVFETTRCPIRIDGIKYFCDRPAPEVGEDNKLLL